jgi:hypothetical protein
MDKSSVTRTSPPSTRAIVADEAFCEQATALLLCDEGPIHNAFIGEPVEEVLAMVRWALSHRYDKGFNTSMSRKLWVQFFHCFKGIHSEVALQRPLLAAP